MPKKFAASCYLLAVRTNEDRWRTDLLKEFRQVEQLVEILRGQDCLRVTDQVTQRGT